MTKNNINRKKEEIDVLPCLGTEYDKYYFIKESEIDFDLLLLSGFLIGHKPSFAMGGHTHDIYQINPHRKVGLDAAKEDSKTITFKEFLQLYDDVKTIKIDKNLLRFIKAHDACFNIYYMSLMLGAKQLEWMPFILPQLKGTCSREELDNYDISSLEEAVAYYDNRVLKHNMDAIVNALLDSQETNANELFKDDANKLQASMTLFYLSTKQEIFKKVLDKYFNGELDHKTIDLLHEK